MLFFELLALFVIAVFVLGLIAFFRSIGQARRIEALEKQVSSLRINAEILATTVDRGFAKLAQAPVKPASWPENAADPGPRVPPPPPFIGIKPAETLEPAGIAPSSVASVPSVAASSPPRGAPPPTQPTPPTPPPAAPSLEERLGTRWVVWVGGIALALGAIFLVQYSLNEGLLGPFARTIAGAVFAATLLGTGEWMRRNERLIPVAPIPSAHIPSVLTAAGTVAAFGTAYAAHALYGFIGPATAFVLLGAIAVGTMMLSALHGPGVAGLGLVASYGTPMLIGGTVTTLWPLVLFLTAVALAAFWLARLRTWLWLAVAAVAGSIIWGFLMLDRVYDVRLDELPLYAYVLAQLAIACWFMLLEPHSGTPDSEATIDKIGTLTIGALTALTCAVLLGIPSVRVSSFFYIPFAFAAGAILAATALRVAPAAGLASLAGLIPIAVALGWRGLPTKPDSTQLAPFAQDILRLPDGIVTYLTTIALLAGAVTLAAVWRLWNGRKLNPGPAYGYALAAVVTPIATLVIAYLRVTQFDRSIPFAGFAVVLAGALYFVADRFDNVGEDNKSAFTRFCVGVFAAGCTAAMVFAFAFVLDRGYLTAAFAVSAATTALFAVIDKIPALRIMVGAIGLLILARVAWDPRIMGADVGKLPILNWLLVGYGAPAAALLFAGRFLKRVADDWPARLSEALGILFVFLLGFFQIRHALNGGDPLTPTFGHVEAGLIATLAFALAYVLVRVDRAQSNSIYRWATLILGTGSVVHVLGSLGIATNPLFTGEKVGGVAIASTLALAYLLPAIAATLLARAARGVRPNWYVMLIAIAALLLFFGYVTLETRHVFRGDIIGIWPFARPWAVTSGAEIWAYSAVWLALGIAFLVYGLARNAIEPRIASAALVGLSVLKIFLFDLSGITGLWRALSFIGLGLVLVAIGLLYQKFLFSRSPAEPATSA